MSVSEVLRRRVEWCATLAASLPPRTVRTALDNLVLKLRNLGSMWERFHTSEWLMAQPQPLLSATCRPKADPCRPPSTKPDSTRPWS